MCTAADLRSRLVDHIAAHVPPTGAPAWKRYAEPAVMLKRAKSLTNGAWALNWREVAPVDRVTRPKTLATALWTVLVSYQLSPASAGGKTTEEQLVATYMDSLRAHLFTGLQGGVGATGSTHVWDGEAVEAALPDGWVFASIRGSSTFYLDME